MTLMKPVALLKDGGGQFQPVHPLHDVLRLHQRAVGHALLPGTPNTARAPAVWKQEGMCPFRPPFPRLVSTCTATASVPTPRNYC